MTFYLFDIDGTITTDKKPIDDDMLAALTSIKDAGHEIGFVTGAKLSTALETLHLAANLGKIWEQNGAKTPINGSALDELFVALNPIMFDVERRHYMYNLRVPFQYLHIRRYICEAIEVFTKGDYMAVIGGQKSIDVMPPENTKAAIFDELPDDVIFFCDRDMPYGNDKPLADLIRKSGGKVVNVTSPDQVLEYIGGLNARRQTN